METGRPVFVFMFCMNPISFARHNSCVDLKSGDVYDTIFKWSISLEEYSSS